MNKGYILLILILIVLAFSLTDYYDERGLDTLAYVVAIGLDKGNENKLKLSLQFAVLTNSSSENSSQSKESTVDTVECDSIDSGINLINSYISKKINLSHCKAIVISEELASIGISEYICTLGNNVELRPNCDVIISKCNAEDFLNNSKPTLETASARHYELSLNSSHYTGYTEEIVLSDFFIDMLSTDSEAYAILGGINTSRTQSLNIATTSYSQDENYTADQTPISGETQIENMGLAVFKNDKLVGELTGIECICNLIISNNLNTAIISIPSPFEENQSIALEISPTKNTSITVDLINNSPYISTTSYINARIFSLSENIDYTNEQNLKKVEEYTNNFLETNISKYLYKTSKEFKSDMIRIW